MKSSVLKMFKQAEVVGCLFFNVFLFFFYSIKVIFLIRFLFILAKT